MNHDSNMRILIQNNGMVSVNVNVGSAAHEFYMILISE